MRMAKYSKDTVSKSAFPFRATSCIGNRIGEDRLFPAFQTKLCGSRYDLKTLDCTRSVATSKCLQPPRCRGAKKQAKGPLEFWGNNQWKDANLSNPCQLPQRY